MDFKVIKTHPGHPEWGKGAILPMDINYAEAYVRGGFLEEYVPEPPPPPVVPADEGGHVVVEPPKRRPGRPRK
jgi:hypothetical protein